MTVNHLWQLVFGGLVRTPDDFGLQGERPTHPELLDWLAIEFMESGWNVKHMVRLMVTSSAYRQRSEVDDVLAARDPQNRLCAGRSASASPVGCSAMRRCAKGLLEPALGGPPVFPYQPENVWEEMTMGKLHYEPTEGPEQYRRTIYAFWRRSRPPAFLFDVAQRRVCEVGTLSTNTPLQVLTLMNDLSYLESARRSVG